MKKLSLLVLLAIVIALPFCRTSKKAAAPPPPPVTYETNIQPLIAANCSPCHFPPKGNKKPLDNYDGVKEEIADILERIQKNPTEKNFMPFKHDKLSDSTIHVFIKWKDDGLLQK